MSSSRPTIDPTDGAAHALRLSAWDDALAAGQVPSAIDAAAADFALLQMLDLLRPPRPPSHEVPEAGLRYVLRGLHAEGGIGRVWLAFDTELGREVALKVLRPERIGDPRLTERFLHEARITGRLQHPGIAPVYELAPGAAAGLDDDQPPFYTMRLVQGRTLTEAIRDFHAGRITGRRPPVERARLLIAFVSVCQTIAYAHARGVIHRDLKPENIALGEYGEVVVLDWGFAKEQSAKADVEPSGSGPLLAPTQSPRHSIAGQMLGTPAYMAPEQAVCGPTDERTDVYGLGAILYELIAGRPPYLGEDSADIIRQVRAGPPPRPSATSLKVPSALEAVCLKACARSPANRYPSAAVLASDVQHWLADEPVTAYREPAAVRLKRWGRRHPAIVASSAVLVFAGLFAAGLAQVLVRQEQAQAADARAKAATELTEAMNRFQADQQVQLYMHRIALAERTLAAHNPKRAIELLADCPVALRDWEWHCLNRLCRGDRAPLRGHTGTIQAIAFSPDGNTLASAGFDRTVRLWDLTTGKSRPPLNGHDGVVYDLAFSPNGRRLASAGWDGTARIWDVDSGRIDRILSGHGGHVEYVAYGDGGRTLFTLASDSGAPGVIRAWDTATGALKREFTFPWQPWSLVASPDGRLLAVGGAAGVVCILDAETGREIRQLLGHQNPVRAVAFGPTGRLLASGDGDIGRDDAGEIRIWDVATGAALQTFRGHTGPVLKVAFSPNNTRLASASQDNTVKIWDLASGQEVLTLHAHTDTVRSVAFSPDGRRLASAGADQVVRIWDATPVGDERPAYELRTFSGHAGRALGVAFRPDSRALASIGADRSIRIWDPDRPEPIGTIDLTKGSPATLPRPDADYFGIAYDLTGRRLITGDSYGSVALLYSNNGHVIWAVHGHGPGPIRGFALRPGGRQFATASWDRTVRIWNIDTGHCDLTLDRHTEPVNAVAYSPDGRWLASAANDQTVRIWNAETGAEMAILHGHSSGVFGVAVSPNGETLASGGNDGTIRLWNTSTWRERAVLRKHTSAVQCVTFSPDGRLLASAGHDWTVRVWRATDGEEIATFRGHSDRLHGLSFSPDAKLLASAGYGGAIKLWDVADLDQAEH